MISTTDLDIYQALFHHKAINEKYIGKVELDWWYSEVYYSAECTIGVPFDMFDKVIVGILQVEEKLSIEQIGGILGMNVVDNPGNGQYKDQAEYDILRMALESLKRYGMVEVGDSYYSTCRLTQIGKEYAKKGRKFKVQANKPFSLVYDHTGNNHLDARTAFEGLKGEPQPDLLRGFNFLNEGLMKQIAAVQVPDICNQETGNSFTKPGMVHEKSRTCVLKLFVAFLYNLNSKTIRLLVYNPNTKAISEQFSSLLDERKKEKLLRDFLLVQNLSGSGSPFPEDYMEELNEKQRQLELVVAQEPQKALALASAIGQGGSYIDVEFFWSNLHLFVPGELKEAWFFLPRASGKILSLIKGLIEQSHQTYVFVIIKPGGYSEEVADQIDQIRAMSRSLSGRGYLVLRELNFSREVLFSGVYHNEPGGYFELQAENILIDVSPRVALTSYRKTFHKAITDDYIIRKTFVALQVLPGISKLINEMVLTVDKDSNVDKAFIQRYENMDQKAWVFKDLQKTNEVLHKIAQVEQVKKGFVRELKRRHQNQLGRQLQNLTEEVNGQQFEKLEALAPYHQAVLELEKEFFPDYQELTTQANLLRESVRLQEKQIRDELLAKTYIIDTNIFIEEPEVVSKIDGKHYVVVSHTVINELDKLKQKLDLKIKASKAMAHLNKLLGKVKHLRTAKANLEILPEDYHYNSPDNRILSVAFMYKEKNPILLTNDNGLQLKAKSIEIPTISLAEFSEVKVKGAEAPKRLRVVKDETSKAMRNETYRNVFRKMEPDRSGKYQVAQFVFLLKKEIPDFDYSKLGYHSGVQFVASLPDFVVYDNKFMKLKI